MRLRELHLLEGRFPHVTLLLFLFLQQRRELSELLVDRHVIRAHSGRVRQILLGLVEVVHLHVRLAQVEYRLYVVVLHRQNLVAVLNHLGWWWRSGSELNGTTEN